jgi:hypothetical protein
MNIDASMTPATDTNPRFGLAPEAITTQYRKAVAGCLEMVRFGAMMIEVESNLTREIGRSRGGGWTPPEDTLKGWLSEHCPEIRYATAMRFKSLAEGVQRTCGLPTGMPMRLALPGPDGAIDIETEWERQGPGRPVSAERLAELRASVWELVEGKSARQLLFSFMAPPADKGGARPVPAAPSPTQAHDDTIALWTEHVRWFHASIRHKEHLLLSTPELKGLMDELAAVRDALRAALGREDERRAI